MMTPQYTDSSFSPWLYQEKPESSAGRLVEYYKLNPFKTPDLIYAEAEQDNAVATITMGEKYNKIKLSDEASLYVHEK